MKISKQLISLHEHDEYIDIASDAARYRIYAMNENIIRVRCSFQQHFPEEASYALVMTGWKDRMDAVIKDRKRISPLSISLQDHGAYYEWATANLVLKIYKEPFAIVFENSSGDILHQDIANRGYVIDDANRIYHYSAMNDDDFYYGFGEKSGPLNKRNRRLRMRNVDTIGYNSESTDPLYKHIPFYIKFNSKLQHATGIFYHNTYDSIFDVGCERSGYWPQYSYYCGDGGELDYFFINGPSIKEVVSGYTDLTGKTMLAPKYSLGYLGSTMFYTELEKRSDQAILSFIDKCKELGIPCDGFFMSSGYTTGKDGKRYVFNWNDARFPDPAQYVRAAEEKGITLSPNVKPGMLLSHPYYDEFAEQGLYIKNELGDAPEIERYWGGMASFVDFTNEAARAKWKHYLKTQLLAHGFSSIWNDNNEYEIQQSNALCHYEGEAQPISALSSVMPNMMALTANEAIEEYDAERRPYVVNRAGYAGIQRYAQTWAGDNSTSWNSLKYNISLILGLGLSGVANQGCDIGGFYGPAPEPELFVRWVQNGIFQPRFSIHSSNTDNTVTEPWMYPSYTGYIREAIQLRYQMVPYLYSLLHEAATTGAPIMRPYVYEFQHDPQVWEESFSFMLGSSLLVSNVIEQGESVHSVYLPEGAEWVEWSTRRRYRGGQWVSLHVDLSSIPMFIRSGGIIPMAQQLMNIHQDKLNTLVLLIEGTQPNSFLYYDDDGISNSYKAGDYNKTIIELQPGDTTTIDITSEGGWKSDINSYEVHLICKENSPVKIECNGELLPRFLDEKEWLSSECGWYYHIEQRTVLIKTPLAQKDCHIQVDFSVKDLISI